MKRSTTRRKGKFILLSLLFVLFAVMIFALYNSILKRPALITHNKVQTYAVFKNHKAPVGAVQFSPDGELIASGTDDATIKIWDIQSGSLLRTLSNGNGHVYTVAFSPDSKHLVSGSRDKDNLGEVFQNFLGDSDGHKGISMQLWDVQSGKLLETVSEHANDVMAVCYSPDGKWIASASTDKTVQIWKTTN